ncbi:hypothetical protein ECANGB1_2210 [Enterospora canceri]|uniref:DUF4203 domain-containing protein n=1 Tax=Enterospora canceri TaxID=1081671 RepID=A0A1Y1S4Y7_9MICR|nr:hypothetical protein ECANGB1_2210 [Enterospora canceri]
MNIFNAVVSLVHEKTSTPKSVDYLHSYRPGYYYCKESTKLKEGDHITKDLIEVVQNKTRMMIQSDNIDQYLKENETSLVVKQLVMMFGALLLTTVIMIKTKSMIPVAISGSMAIGIRLFYELSFSDEPGKRLLIVALTLVIVSVICCFIDLAMNTLLLLMFAFTSSFTILLFTGVTANQVEFTNGLWFNILSYDHLMKQGIEFNYNKWLIILGILTMISIFFNIYTAKRTKTKKKSD